jgi:hypothetical protein
MRVRRLSQLAILFCATVLIALPALAQTAVPSQPAVPGIQDLDCRTLLRLDGREREFTLLYYHGFVSGRLNEARLDAQVMSAATDQVIDHCIDRPGDKVLDVFERYRKKR